MKNFILPRLYNRFKPDSKYSAKILLADDVKIKDISFGGVLLETEKHLNINGSYRIQIRGLNDKVIMPDGVVVWATLKCSVKKNHSSAPIYHVALKFVKLSDTEKRYLDELISNL